MLLASNLDPHSTAVEAVTLLYWKMLAGRDDSARAETLDWIDGIDLAEWEGYVRDAVGGDELQRMEDDALFAALGLSREQLENEVASPG